MTRAATRLRSIIATSLLTASLVSGCVSAADEGDSTSPSRLVGLDFSAAEELIPRDAGLLVQDASPRVDVPADFADADIGSTRWVIVSACADDERLSSASVVEVAVIPKVEFEGLDPDGWEASFADAVACDF